MQETNEIFWLYMWLVHTLKIKRFLINSIVINEEKKNITPRKIFYLIY